jgi:gentisate 1,2-dioxygenase
VWQVFVGAGVVTLAGVDHALEHGDVFVILMDGNPLHADTQLDLCCFSDVPVFESSRCFEQRLRANP